MLYLLDTQAPYGQVVEVPRDAAVTGAETPCAVTQNKNQSQPSDLPVGRGRELHPAETRLRVAVEGSRRAEAAFREQAGVAASTGQVALASACSKLTI